MAAFVAVCWVGFVLFVSVAVASPEPVVVCIVPCSAFRTLVLTVAASRTVAVVARAMWMMLQLLLDVAAVPKDSIH